MITARIRVHGNKKPFDVQIPDEIILQPHDMLIVVSSHPERMPKGTVKLWLDDRLDDPEVTDRHTPPGWVGVKTPEEAILLIKTGQVEEMSLDHDLGLTDDRTGYTVLKWLEEVVITEAFVPPRVIKIHTDNGPGRSNMEAALRSIRKHS